MAYAAKTVSEVKEIAKICHSNSTARGWWEGVQNIYIKIQLANTEVAEATEGVRKDLFDTHLPHRKMEEVEAADTMARLLDIGGHLGYEYENPEHPNFLNGVITKADHPAEAHLWVTMAVCNFAWFLKHSETNPQLSSAVIQAWRGAVGRVILWCEKFDLDLWGALEEKLAYNLQRPDHDPSNRNKSDGKKF